VSVVISKLPTIASWIDGSDAVRLVPPLATTNADDPVPDDVPRFVGDLRQAICEALIAAPRGESVAARVRAHSWAQVFGRYESVYEEAIARRIASGA
jgi:hypothetical protein